MNKTLIFVYGTLLRGEPNDRLLRHVKCSGRTRTEARYTLVSLGGFPGLLEGGEEIVEGELYSVDAATLERLDRLEGHPSFYERRAVAIEGMNAEIQAYVLPRERYEDHPRILSGSWREPKARRCPNCKRLVTESEIKNGALAHHGGLEPNPTAYCAEPASLKHIFDGI
jgi:gamma-glutamylcyclotransferase (GGCT)/AIG2-like uncharacterized protein YtfP